MEPVTKEIIVEKKGVCYFEFEDRMYEIPIEKYFYLKIKIEHKIKEYREERARLIKKFYGEMASLGVIEF